MQLNPLTLNDKPVFDKYASLTPTKLSYYAFPALYVWREHFQFYWKLLQDHFCVFAKQGGDFFLPILPMGSPFSYEVAIAALRYCLESNKNPQIARIENVHTEVIPVFRKMGYHIVQKETEYIYGTEKLAKLSGNLYKSKRYSYNTFVRRFPHVRLLPYSVSDLEGCLALYEKWQKSRQEDSDDEIYLTMLDDSQIAHRIGISEAHKLGLVGRIVRIDGEIKAYTFGYPLNTDIFCILFEISDLNINGLSQFIYREYCRELMVKYRWINAMDDSGLDNLKRVKQSYHPTQLVASYNVYENSTNLP